MITKILCSINQSLLWIINSIIQVLKINELSCDIRENVAAINTIPRRKFNSYFAKGDLNEMPSSNDSPPWLTGTHTLCTSIALFRFLSKHLLITASFYCGRRSSCNSEKIRQNETSMTRFTWQSLGNKLGAR